MERNIDNEFIKDTLEKDVFKRNKLAIQLINKIITLQEQHWIAINGDWGSGKSVFVKQVEYLINNKEDYENISIRNRIKGENTDGLDVFYFNSWENDMIQNPISSILFQIIKKYDLDSTSEKYNELVNREVLNRVVKTLSGGLLDISKPDIADVLDEYYTAEEIKIWFNQLISQILTKKRRLLIIIDELDRCRPTYAIELLEMLKHFYNHNSVTFLFAVNINQLKNTIKKVYGNDYDGESYLYRFFSKIINFHEFSKEKYIETYLDFYIEKDHIAYKTCEICIRKFDLSIRQTTEFINSVNFHIDFIEGSSTGNQTLLFMTRNIIFIIGLALRCRSRSEYKDFLRGDFDISNIVSDNEEYQNWIEDAYEHYSKKTKKEGIPYLTSVYKAIFKERNTDKFGMYYEYSKIINELEMFDL